MPPRDRNYEWQYDYPTYDNIQWEYEFKIENGQIFLVPKKKKSRIENVE